MNELELLRELFDEKIIKIINIFLENPNQTYSLTQIASLANVSISTTLRIIERLTKQKFIEIELVGKTKYYKMKKNEKTLALSKLLKKDEPVSEFVDVVSKNQKIKKIIVEDKRKEQAKIILVGDSIERSNIEKTIQEIVKKYNFNIQFVEMSEKQYKDMIGIGLYGLEKKIVWER